MAALTDSVVKAELDQLDRFPVSDEERNAEVDAMKAIATELAGRQRQIWVEVGPLVVHAEQWVVVVCMRAAILRGTHVRVWLPFRDQSHVLGSGTSDGDRAMSEAKAKCHPGHRNGSVPKCSPFEFRIET